MNSCEEHRKRFLCRGVYIIYINLKELPIYIYIYIHVESYSRIPRREDYPNPTSHNSNHAQQFYLHFLFYCAGFRCCSCSSFCSLYWIFTFFWLALAVKRITRPFLHLTKTILFTLIFTHTPVLHILKYSK